MEQPNQTTPESEEPRFGVNPRTGKPYARPSKKREAERTRALSKQLREIIVSENEKLRVALAACRNKFAEYTRIHDAKATSEGRAKAVANREMWNLCNAALGEPEGAESPVNPAD